MRMPYLIWRFVLDVSQSGIDIIAGNFQQGMKEASTEAVEGTSNIACILRLSQVRPCSLGFSFCGKI